VFEHVQYFDAIRAAWNAECRNSRMKNPCGAINNDRFDQPLHVGSNPFNQKENAMTFDPILNASGYIQIHAACATLSIVPGPFAMYRRRRDFTHKTIGYIWMVAMAIAATSSFWIREVSETGDLSPIHLFAVATLGTIVYANWMVRRGNIIAHKRSLHNLFYFGNAGPVIFNFLPGRTLPNMIFDGGTLATFATAAGLIIGIILVVKWAEHRRILVI